MATPQYKVEYAKSNRSSCKKCKNGIEKDSLRFAKMIQAPNFDGMMPLWLHFDCFFAMTKRNVVDPTLLEGFESLRWDDQTRIKEKIAAILNGDVGDNKKKDAKLKKADSLLIEVADENYTAEYAKSSRSVCRICGNKIMKEELRLGKKEVLPDKKGICVDTWYHLDCFSQNRAELEFDGPAETFTGYTSLSDDDRKLLNRKFGTISSLSKRKKDDDVNGTADVKKTKTELSLSEDERKLKEQTDTIWKLKDDLRNNVSKNDMKQLLQNNNQVPPSGESQLVDALTDCLLFGALEPCPECSGQLICSRFSYVCTGSVTEWTKCQNKTCKPARKTAVIEDEYKTLYPFLGKLKLKVRERIFPPEVEVENGVSTLNGKPSPASSGKKKRLLEGLMFCSIGKLKFSAKDISKLLSKHGAEFHTKMSGLIFAAFSSADELKKGTKKTKDAEKLNIPILSQDFLSDLESGAYDAVIGFEKYRLSSWGCFSERQRSGAHSKSVNDNLEKVKLKVKGGATVDPDSGLEDTCHVLRDPFSKKPMSVVLGLVDVMRGSNSYYKIQLLESDDLSEYYVFRAWGRVGTTIGGNKIEPFDNMDDACENFENIYYDKTGNRWNCFTKKMPNKFYPLDIDHGSECKVLDESSSKVKCTLPEAVQRLIRLIFDIKAMERTLLEYEIDLKKMPLGKISRSQIHLAFNILNEINSLIEKDGTNTQFLDATNRFFTLVPHDFGVGKPPIIKSIDQIKSKTEMLNNLNEIEIAYSMLNAGDENENENPLDTHYQKLKCSIQTVPIDSDEYKLVYSYVKNTHASTHNTYTLEIEELYKVVRENEESSYLPFKRLPNRMLLWHGSRLTNFAGILSQGLRIAPPEAPVTGYMFGKGVYFADMVSKSANYCCASISNPIGLLLLCEVALGNMYERTHAEFIKKLPPGKHSTKGVGKTMPDPSKNVELEDGTIVPLGRGIPSSHRSSSLLYNEYIVYDVNQINVKYLVMLRFIYE